MTSSLILIRNFIHFEMFLSSLCSLLKEHFCSLCKEQKKTKNNIKKIIFEFKNINNQNILLIKNDVPKTIRKLFQNNKEKKINSPNSEIRKLTWVK